jgi:hypothetical protein
MDHFPLLGRNIACGDVWLGPLRGVPNQPNAHAHTNDELTHVYLKIPMDFPNNPSLPTST